MIPLALQGQAERAGRGPGQLDEAGVEQGRVLALEQADAAEPVGEGDRDVGTLFEDDGGGFFLAGGVQRRENGGDGDRADPGVADPPGGRAHAAGVERDERAAVELVAALQHHHLAADEGREVLRPVDERGQGGARGQADAHRGDAAEVAPLHHGIGEVGRPDHGGVGIARGGRLLRRARRGRA